MELKKNSRADILGFFGMPLMNPVLQEIERTGTTLLSSGERTQVRAHVDAASGDVLRRAVEATQPRVACEVGLAFGVSTLHIMDAMKHSGDGVLLGMDPSQHSETWRGGGLANVQRAGFADRYRFHEETSQACLPRLAAAGTRIQFAFLDGWHTFDHTLVDFFYVDQMLDVGGIVVLDDVGYPGLQRLAHFIVTNRAYEFFDGASRPAPSGWRQHAKRSVQAALRPLVRDNFTPGDEACKLKLRVDGCKLVALRKRADDGRSYNHFAAF